MNLFLILKKTGLYLLVTVALSCSGGYVPVRYDALVPVVISDTTCYDSDDPVLWLHPDDPGQSLVFGTDKGSLQNPPDSLGGGIFVYNLLGEKVNYIPADWPNNIDIAYGFLHNGVRKDIVVFTERYQHTIRVYSVPELEPLDGGGIPVFEGEGEDERDPMGIGLYTRMTDTAVFAIVSRVIGPGTDYLWQYQLKVNEGGDVTGELVRKFGVFSQKKSIEAVVVDNELGYVYYADESFGIRKYHADPAKQDNTELALFSTNEVADEHEGMALYKSGDATGYILVSNQHANSILVYPREGEANNPHMHTSLADVPVSSLGPDGVTASSAALNDRFPQGTLITMNSNRTFQFYDWRDVQDRINQGHISAWKSLLVLLHGKAVVIWEKVERRLYKYGLL